MANSDERFGKPKRQFPPNIAEATPSHVRANLSSWDDDILIRRAARLKMSKEAACAIENKPLFLVEAEERAKVEGRSLRSVLNCYSQELQRSQYPTPDCLDSDEIASYAEKGHLERERLEHAQQCNECSVLMSISRSGSPVKARASVVVLRNLRKWVTLGAPALLVLALTYSALATFGNGSAASPYAWIISVFGSFAFLAMHRGLQSFPTARNVVSSIIVGLAISGVVWVQFLQESANSQITRQWARERTESLVLSAMEQQLTTGKFPEPDEASAMTNEGSEEDVERLRVEAPTVTRDSATYIVKVPNANAKIVAQMQANDGGVTIDDSKTVERLQMLMGTVKSDGSEKGILTQEGTFYKVGHQRDFFLAPGTRVVALVDQSTSRVDKYRAVGFLAKPVLPR